MRQGATMLTAKQKSMLNVLIDHLEKLIREKVALKEQQDKDLIARS